VSSLVEFLTYIFNGRNRLQTRSISLPATGSGHNGRIQVFKRFLDIFIKVIYLEDRGDAEVAGSDNLMYISSIVVGFEQLDQKMRQMAPKST